MPRVLVANKVDSACPGYWWVNGKKLAEKLSPQELLGDLSETSEGIRFFETSAETGKGISTQHSLY